MVFSSLMFAKAFMCNMFCTVALKPFITDAFQFSKKPLSASVA